MYNVLDAVPTYATGVAANGTTLATPVPEPTNNPSAFIKGVLTTSNIPVSWTAAAAGAQAPLGYLLQADIIATPNDGTDGTDPVNQTNISRFNSQCKNSIRHKHIQCFHRLYCRHYVLFQGKLLY